MERPHFDGRTNKAPVAGGHLKRGMAGSGARPRSRNLGADPFSSSSESSLVCRNVPLGDHSVAFWRETYLQAVVKTEDVSLSGSDRYRAKQKWASLQTSPSLSDPSQRRRLVVLFSQQSKFQTLWNMMYCHTVLFTRNKDDEQRCVHMLVCALNGDVPWLSVFGLTGHFRWQFLLKREFWWSFKCFTLWIIIKTF